jgi:hypothetical protein
VVPRSCAFLETAQDDWIALSYVMMEHRGHPFVPQLPTALMTNAYSLLLVSPLMNLRSRLTFA